MTRTSEEPSLSFLSFTFKLLIDKKEVVGLLADGDISDGLAFVHMVSSMLFSQSSGHISHQFKASTACDMRECEVTCLIAQ